MIKLKVIIAILILAGGGFVLDKYVLKNNKTDSPEVKGEAIEQEPPIAESHVATSTAEQIEIENLKKELEAVKNQELEVVEKPVYIQPKQNNDLILVNYKIDVQDGEDLRATLINAAYGTPSQMCSSIIANRTTRQHIYYSVLDDIARLKSKYGQYRSSISYIDNNLRGLDGTIQIVKDQCEAQGYIF